MRKRGLVKICDLFCSCLKIVGISNEFLKIYKLKISHFFSDKVEQIENGKTKILRNNSVWFWPLSGHHDSLLKEM